MRPIAVQKQDETQTVVKSGLEPPERVVTTGFVRLTDGSKVAIGSAECAGASAARRARSARRAANGNAAAATAETERAAMSVSSPFIHRPIATSLLGVAVMLGGCLGYWWLPVSALPQVDFPTIQVTTQLPGANPDTIAALVTAPLERQFGQIPALQTMTSSSSFGISQVTLQFDLNRDIDAAAQDVQSAINAAASTLPRNLPYPPLYSKVNPADAPIITLALTSQTHRSAHAQRHGRHHHGAAAVRSDRRRPRLGAGRYPARRSAFRPTCRGSPPMASRWMICARPSSAPMSPAPKARSTARTSPTPSPPTIRSPPPMPTRTSWWRSATARR